MSSSARELSRLMIVRSSNLATNLLVDELGAAEIQNTIEGLGVRRMRVLRGVKVLDVKVVPQAVAAGVGASVES